MRAAAEGGEAAEGKAPVAGPSAPTSIATPSPTGTSSRPPGLFAPGIPDLIRDSESVLAGYLSMSLAAAHLFGERVEEFAADVRALLASRSPGGVFWDWPGDTEIVLARKSG